MCDQPTVGASRITWSQEQDSCGPAEDKWQLITVSRNDGGGGMYWTIETERWSFDDIEDLVELIRRSTVDTKGEVR